MADRPAVRGELLMTTWQLVDLIVLDVVVLLYVVLGQVRR